MSKRDERENRLTEYREVGGEYCETLQFCRYDKLRLSIVPSIYLSSWAAVDLKWAGVLIDNGPLVGRHLKKKGNDRSIIATYN